MPAQPAEVMQLTAYPEVDALLRMLLAEAKRVLGRRFVGLYVHGSVASGDFAPPRSDIDFVVVTADELPEEMLPALGQMHARMRASGLKWAERLEGSYIPQQALLRYDAAHAQHPALSMDGHFGVDGHGSDWIIQRHLIREGSIAVAGPAPQTLIDPVAPEEIRRAVRASLDEWWSPMLQDSNRLRSREYQAYAVLTMCRALYTLEHGSVVSKTVAAQWTLETSGGRWAALIERALAWPHGSQPDSLSETQAFIRYTVERSQQIETPAGVG